MASAAAVSIEGHDGYNPILPGQVETEAENIAGVEFDNAAAASLVRQDYERARAYLDNMAWQAQWEENDILYQSPYIGPYNDGRFARVSRFGVNNDTNTMADATRAAVFAQKPCYFLRPRGKTSDDEIRAWTALLDTLLDRMKFTYHVGMGIDSQALHGTMIMKGGWSTRTVTKWVREREKETPKIGMPQGDPLTAHSEESDKFKLVPKEKTQSYPWIENRLIGTTFFDPAWSTPNRPDLCRYAIDADPITWRDLEELRQMDCYDIPDSEALKAYFFANRDSGGQTMSQVEQTFTDEGSPVLHAESRMRPTTADPLDQPGLLLERWSPETVITVIELNGRDVCIRNTANKEGRIPHFSANWRSILNCGYGIGIGRLAGGDQRLEQGVLNHSVNLLAYQLSPAILIAAGTNTPTANREVRAGGFFPVTPLGDDVRKAMAVMEMPQIPAEAWQMIKYSQESRQESSGSDRTFMQGQLGGQGSSAARTATGAGRIAAKADARVQTPVENVAQGIIVEYVVMLIDMIRRYMPYAEIREILTDKLGEEIVKRIDTYTFLDAEMIVECLAGERLAAKAAMAQQLPYMMQVAQQPQLLEQLHQEGKTADIAALFKTMYDVSEFRNGPQIIRNLTQQELQLIQASNPGIAKVQGDIAVEKQKGENMLEKSDRDAKNKLAVDLGARAGEHIIAQEEGQTQHTPADPTDKRLSPLDRAGGLVQRSEAEDVLEGKAGSFLVGA